MKGRIPQMGISKRNSDLTKPRTQWNFATECLMRLTFRNADILDHTAFVDFFFAKFVVDNGLGSFGPE